MVFALTTFCISLVFIIAMVANKMREVSKGRAYVAVSAKLDDSIRHKMIIAKKLSTEFPRHFGREAFYAFVQKSVLVFRKLRGKIYPRIAHIVDAVKGKDIPKNKGGASFFLVHIQEHKEKMEEEEKLPG